MSASIDWQTARRVAGWLANRGAPQDVDLDAMAVELDDLTAQAEEIVSAETGLVSLAGPARAQVVDREGWVEANIGSFRRLLRPMIEKIEARATPGMISHYGSIVTGAQLGGLLGWMSTRVLGQYDLLVVEGEDEERQDLVYYVGPNIFVLEERFGFDPHEFRFWIALHEVTHRAQFTGVPWMREHFLSMVHSMMGSVEPDPKRFIEAFRRVADEVRAGRDPFAEGGLPAIVATPEQRETMYKLQGLMSLLEGHGDIIMDRAAEGRVEGAERFHHIMNARRSSVRGPAKLMQRLIGLEAKLKQYEEGEEFIRIVEADGGRELFDLVWSDPDLLPDVGEIRDPTRWAKRVRKAGTDKSAPEGQPKVPEDQKKETIK